MSRPLRLLLVQDSEADAAFVTDLLGKTGHRVAALRVAGEDGLRAALTQGPWDIALCSHRGSGLAVERALTILHATGGDLPVFVLCERFEETEAVGLMRAGARDCLPWDGMARLVPAIERELASTDVRRRLSESVRRYRGMLANLNDALIIDDISGRVVFANERFLELFGIGHAALDHLVLEDYVAPEYRTLLRERHDRRIAGETVPDRFEYEGLRGDGTRMWLEVRVSPVLENGALIGTQSIIQDIGERKLSEQTQTALREIAEAALAAADLSELYQRIHRIIDALLPAPNFYVALYDRRTDMVEFPYFVDEHDPQPLPQKLGEISLTAVVLRSGKPILLTPSKPGDGASAPPVVGTPPAEWLGVPLIAHGETVGVLAVQSYSGGVGYSERHRQLLEFVSAHVAAAIERKQSETRIRESEEKFRAVFDNSPNLIGLLTVPEGVIVEINRAAVEKYGGGKEEMLGRTSVELGIWHSPEDRDRYLELLRRDGSVWDFETVIQRKNGDTFPALYSGALLTIAGRRYSLNIMQDITERKHAEEMLRAERNFSNAVLDSAASPVVVLDWEGRIRRFNRAAEQLSGYVFYELEGRFPWRTLLPPDRAEQVRREAFEALINAEDGPRTARYTNEWLTLSGERRMIEWFNSVLLHASGRPEFLVSVGVDVTERLRMEDQLRRSEQRLRQAQAIARIGSWEIDLTNNTLWWSDEVYRLFGVDSKRFQPSFASFLELVHPDDRARVESAYRRSVVRRGPYQITHRVFAADGQYLVVEEHCETEYADDGRPLRSSGTVQDVTERVAANESLRRSLLEKETLLREIHHRVKNNLQIIASLLYFESMKTSEAAALKAFEETRDRLAAMILVHEKLYASNNLAEVEVPDYVGALVARLTQTWWSGEAERVTLRLDIAPIRLTIDSLLPCGMILVELLTNIHKYAFPGGRRGKVEIRLRTHEGRVLLRVEDDGVGMPPGFDPEHTASFGWRLIGNLVRQIDGTVSLDDGGGTRVVVEFPHRGVEPEFVEHTDAPRQEPRP